MIAPTLSTERLMLRAPRLDDFEHWAAFYASARSRHEGGPLDRRAAYRRWAADVALWSLRGYGAFGIEDRASGAYLGEVGVYQPEGFPGPELGWFVVPEAEGRGIASEAARAVMVWLRETFGWDEIVSIIEPENTRSIALAHRLGGVTDARAPGITAGDVVIRHDLTGVAQDDAEGGMEAYA